MLVVNPFSPSGAIWTQATQVQFYLILCIVYQIFFILSCDILYLNLNTYITSIKYPQFYLVRFLEAFEVTFYYKSNFTMTEIKR